MEEKDANGLGIASLVLGILGLVLIWVPFLGFLLSLGAVILGGIAMKNTDSKGMAVAGLVLGIVSLAIMIVVLILGVLLFAAF